MYRLFEMKDSKGWDHTLRVGFALDFGLALSSLTHLHRNSLGLEKIMESSFKKTYEKKQNPDGSFDIIFQSSKLRGNPIGFYIAWVMPSFYITYKLLDGITGSMAARMSGGQAFTLWVVLELLVLILPPYFLVKLLQQDEVITVLPNQGIKFGERSLPFNDIQTLGTSTLGNQRKNCHVYAVSHGTNIKVSGNVTGDLAEAVANELRAASGSTWK